MLPGASVMKNAVNSAYPNASTWFISHPQGLDGQSISNHGVPTKFQGVRLADTVQRLTGGTLGTHPETPQNYTHARILRKSLSHVLHGSGGRAQLARISSAGRGQQQKGKNIRLAAFSHARRLPWQAPQRGRSHRSMDPESVHLGALPASMRAISFDADAADAAIAAFAKKAHSRRGGKPHAGASWGKETETFFDGLLRRHAKQEEGAMLRRRLKREDGATFLNAYHNINPYSRSDK